MKHITRKTALTDLLIVPIAAGAVLAVNVAPAEADDNKAQYKYQDQPGAGGAKCSECSLFQSPSSCSVVTGTISPNGWCVAFAKS
jgi:hypothetical protein